jgi:hypothetical protein
MGGADMKVKQISVAQYWPGEYYFDDIFLAKDVTDVPAAN